MLNRKLKFLFLSLICFLSFSCSLSVLDTADVKFNLPTNRNSASTGDVITYTITLQNMDGNVIYNETTTSTQIKINNIPIGNYYIAIKGKDSTFTYCGDKTFYLKAGDNNKIRITLTKTKIETESGNDNNGSGTTPELPEDAVLKSIDVELNKNMYVPYGSKIDIKNFKITEHYSKGDPIVVSNDGYNKYSITPNTEINELKNVAVTITRKDNSKITKESSIPCKIELGTPVIELNHTGTVSVEKGTTAPEITATVTPSKNMPAESYEETEISWTKNENESVSTTKSFTPDITTEGATTYKFSVKYKIKSGLENFCIGNSSTTANASVTVNVTSPAGGSGGGDAGGGSQNTAFEKLKADIAKVSEYGSVSISEDIVMDEPIVIKKAFTLKSTKPVTLTRGANNNGDMFLIQTGTLTLGDANNSSNIITLDGNKASITKSKQSGSLINIPEGQRLNVHNCILQNNKNTTGGGGAIFSDHGQIELNNTKILNNEAASYGGGIYIITGKAAMTNVAFEGNKSGASGGAMAFDANCSEVSLNNTNTSYKVQNNTAQSYAGGVYVSEGSFKLQNGTISNNTSKTSGNGNNAYIKSTGTKSKQTTFNGTTVTFDCPLDNEITSSTKPVRPKKIAPVVTWSTTETNSNITIKNDPTSSNDITISNKGIFTDLCIDKDGYTHILTNTTYSTTNPNYTKKEITNIDYNHMIYDSKTDKIYFIKDIGTYDSSTIAKLNKDGTISGSASIVIRDSSEDPLSYINFAIDNNNLYAVYYNSVPTSIHMKKFIITDNRNSLTSNTQGTAATLLDCPVPAGKDFPIYYEIKDVIVHNNKIYTLCCDSSNNFDSYSKGMLLSCSLAGTDIKNIGLCSGNTPDSDTEQNFFGPTSFISIDGNNLLIADDGILGTSDINRIVTFDTSTDTITNVKAEPNATFDYQHL